MTTTAPDTTITPIKLPDKRRFFHAMDDSGVRYLMVKPSLGDALRELAELDLTDARKLSVKELHRDAAERYRVRPGDDSPAETLADAPMGAVYSTEA